MLSFARPHWLNLRIPYVSEPVLGMEDPRDGSLSPRIPVETSTPDADLLAQLGASQLKFALLNLAVHARDAMPDGGFTEITTRDPARA